jgi:hypothetical protein
MKCLTEGCKNKAVPGRKTCNTCQSKKYRAKYPLKYWYRIVKYNAKRRNKTFTLTIEEFETFCIKTGYDKNKGKTAFSLSIDRINPLLGYSMDNIRAITLSENSKIRNRCIGMIEEDAPF